ncbi:MAG: U32 family peptidase [Clostridia bacterium]|nr:U32 family peptidase [Clostridia bacterium]
MIEILSPAGGEECAYAAINAGTDAIYLGLDRFSARSSAENFNDENFSKISSYARLFGVKGYVALNTIVKDHELESFLNSVVSAWNGGADAIILQDLFLGKFIKKAAPQINLHLSTQAGTCNELGAKLAKDFGFDRVILARETKIADIEKISKIIETETFIQGALCTCFSGQCYMSSFAGGNSGNRGKCKQPCRKLYSIDRSGFEEQAYRLSLSDLSVGEDINSLINAGVTSFKIEGRMRRPEYVAAAVNYYKSILSGKNGDVSALKRTYNRGNYTKGLAFGQDKSFISSAVQGHIGEYAGIIKVENGKYILQSNLKLSVGDGFKILRGGKEVGGGTCGGASKSGYVVNTRVRLKNGDKVLLLRTPH